MSAAFGPAPRDPHGDGLTNYQDIVVYGTNPNVADTDSDGAFSAQPAGRPAAGGRCAHRHLDHVFGRGGQDLPDRRLARHDDLGTRGNRHRRQRRNHPAVLLHPQLGLPEGAAECWTADKNENAFRAVDGLDDTSSSRGQKNGFRSGLLGPVQVLERAQNWCNP